MITMKATQWKYMGAMGVKKKGRRKKEEEETKQHSGEWSR